MDDRIAIRVKLAGDARPHSTVFVHSGGTVSSECLCRPARGGRICPHIEAAVSGDPALLDSATDVALAKQVRQWIRNDTVGHILNGEVVPKSELHKLVELTHKISLKYDQSTIDMRNDSDDNPGTPNKTNGE